MKKTRSNLWLVIAVLVAAALLLWWLFMGTTLEEETTPLTTPLGQCISSPDRPPLPDPHLRG